MAAPYIPTGWLIGARVDREMREANPSSEPINHFSTNIINRHVMRLAYDKSYKPKARMHPAVWTLNAEQPFKNCWGSNLTAVKQ